MSFMNRDISTHTPQSEYDGEIIKLFRSRQSVSKSASLGSNHFVRYCIRAQLAYVSLPISCNSILKLIIIDTFDSH